MSAAVRKPRKPLPAGLPVTDEEAERTLLHRLESDISDSDYIATVEELSVFYSRFHRTDLAVGMIKIIMKSTDNTETRAYCYLSLGQLGEQLYLYDRALELYAQGLVLKPKDKKVAYFLHNNAGYCLNLLGKHAEAERYCRLAIEIDSNRYNAFKNLGISLAGKNDLVGAAWAYVKATKIWPLDPRAFHLLEKLLTDHPELPSQYPGILRELEACRTAVETPAEPPIAEDRSGVVDTYRICLLKYIPGKGFLQLKDGVERVISAEEIERLYTEEALKMLGQYPNTWCSIVGEDEKRTSQARKNGVDSIPTFKSRTDYLAWQRSLLPCLMLRGQLLERLKEN